LSKRLFLRAAGAAATGVLLQACGGGGGGGGTPIGSDTLMQILQQDGSLSLFAQAVSRAGLVGRYGSTGASLTLFAADNDAMNRLGARLGVGDGGGLINALSESQWAAILNFSTLPQAISRATLDEIARRGLVDERPETLHSFEGNPQPLIFVFENNTYVVWDGIGRVTITITREDIGASNGVLHVLSDPVLPRGVLTVSQMLRASIDAFSGFAEQMVARGVSTELDGAGPYTVFAPGFVSVGTLSRDAVRHHVTPGRLDGDAFGAQRTLTPLIGRQYILRAPTGATPTLSYGTSLIADVQDTDFWASNGVIHTLDAVIPL
jgi:uncharacterized surface protein with fasciclin (FAS1) repeats